MEPLANLDESKLEDDHRENFVLCVEDDMVSIANKCARFNKTMRRGMRYLRSSKIVAVQDFLKN